jgi:hypothetical protein
MFLYSSAVLLTLINQRQHNRNIEMVSVAETRERTDPAALRTILQYATTEALARAQNLEFPRQVHERVERQAAQIENAFIGIVPIIKRVVTFLTVGTILLSLSLFLYGLLYLIVMPSYNAAGKLYFDYSGIAKHPAPVPVCPDDTSICDGMNPMSDKLLIDKTPWAVADLFSKHSQWEAFHSECIPKPLTDSRILKPGNAYYLEVTLDLPESEINLMSGVFGVLVEIQSHNGTMLATSLRSSRIPHETAWVSTVRKVVMLMPLLIGASQESRRVSVPSFRHFVESPEMPLVRRSDHTWSIGRQMSCLTSSPFYFLKRYVTVKLIQERRKAIEVTTGSVRIGRELSDIQLFLNEYFFTCYAIGTFIFFISQLFVLAVGRLYLEEKRRMRHMEEEPSLNLELDGSQAGSQFGPPDDVAWDEANEVPLNAQTNSNEQSRETSQGQTERSQTPPLSQENT